MRRVGLVGCGTIGTQLARAIERQYRATARITALHDTDRTRAQALQRRLRTHPPVVALPALLRRCDLILEAASVEAAGPLAAAALRRHRDVLIMSVGGLLRHTAWRRLVRRSPGRLFIPSGALAGLDGVKAMAVGRIRRIALTTSKPPAAFAAAPGARRRSLRRLTRPVVLFAGSPRRVIEAFPQNTNVAAALALAAGRAGARARIRVVADPAIRRNRHEVRVTGDGGELACAVESRPSRNPKTSELAVRSAVATLARVLGTVQLGT
jgi:aspartate dehydrogenase